MMKASYSIFGHFTLHFLFVFPYDVLYLDSKTLTEEQRDRMFDDLNSKPDKIGWMVHILSPHYISTCMLRR